MNGIDFIWPALPPRDRPKFDKITLALVAPPPYLAKNPLSEHLETAMSHPVAYLSAQDHRNEKTGKMFECISYYADDPNVDAFTALHENLYLSTISAPFVRRLVKICARMTPVLRLQHEKLKRWYKPPGDRGPEPVNTLAHDDILTKLLESNLAVSEAEAQEMVAHWPAANTEHAHLELGEYALFYDMIRLIWLHEWAHALCGHVAFVTSELHLSQLDEFSAQRLGGQDLGKLKYPRNHVLQALEAHADDFALSWCINEILWGWDPIGQMAGPYVDLIERLLIFNAACTVFAIVWSLGEQRFAPGITFYPPPQPLDSDEPDPMFMAFKVTHPPAALRYLLLRSKQRNWTWDYAQKKAKPMLLTAVDAFSFEFVTTAANLDEHFSDLRKLTPVLSDTPTMKRLDAYENYLLKIGRDIEPRIVELNFLPTRDPYQEPGQ